MAGVGFWGFCKSSIEIRWSLPARTPTLRNGATTRAKDAEQAVRDLATPFQRGERDSPPPPVGRRRLP